MSFNRIAGVYMSYEIIGKGGYATVLKGVYQNKTVAIKLPHRYKNNNLFALNLNKEIEVIKLITDFKDKHPDQEIGTSNILDYYGFYSNPLAKNEIRLVMEYSDYGDLTNLIYPKKNIHSKLPPFDWTFGYSILKNITFALSFLHNELNLIHGDVKPENILLFKNTVNDQVVVTGKLSDFGLTVNKDGQEVDSFAPLYSAPEILNRESPPSEKSDVYGLACVIWEMQAQEPIYNEFHNEGKFRSYINSGKRAEIPSSKHEKIPILNYLGWLNEEQRPTTELYLDAFKTDIDTVSEELQKEYQKALNYALFDAIKNGNVDNVKTLLEKITNVNDEIPIFKSPLHYALINQKHEIAELLLKKGANVNLEIESGVDALTLATRNNDHDMVQLLLKYGADPRNALCDSIQNRDVDRVELLLKNGANVNLEIESGVSAFDLAIKNNDLEMVNLLLKYGANKTKTTEDKREAPKEKNTGVLIKLGWLGEKERSATKPYLNNIKTDIDTLSEELPQKRSGLNLNP